MVIKNKDQREEGEKGRKEGIEQITLQTTINFL